MGKCKYCGQPAGFLRSKHPECEAEHQRQLSERIQRQNELAKAKQAIIAEAAADLVVGRKPFELNQKLEHKMDELGLAKEDMRQLLPKIWGQAVDAFLEDGLLDSEEETRLALFKEHFALSSSDLDDEGKLSQVVKAGILRDIMQGKIPERVQVSGSLPFNLQKKETIIWLFNGVDYYEEKTRRQYVGGSSGVSIRIAKGVYYRTSSFRGRPVDVQETVHMGRGPLAVTNLHLYFSGHKSFRIRHNKIVSIEPHSDGVTVQRDAQTAKPQSFITGDGWFTYNLLTNVSQL